MGNKRSLISLQDLAARTELTPSTLNYYSNMGLISVADRRGNKRFFNESEVLDRLQEIQRLRREGYPLRIIRRHLQEGALA